MEGPTEEEFVKSVLADHLRQRRVEPTPILIGRARGSTRGGNVSIQRLASDMTKLYWSFDFVTSLVDLYGFRGKRGTVDELEQCLKTQVKAGVGHGWDQRRVLPYIQKHEFEGLLFSDATAFRVIMKVSEEDIMRLSDIRSRFPTPEEIDSGPETTPSRRISNVIAGYRKRLYGPLVAQEIGIAVIRGQCPRFDRWVSRLESLGG